MSNKYAEPWSIAEKTGLVLNILQGQNPDLLSLFLQIVHEQRVVPRWDEIALPEGRSLHACKAMFDELHRSMRTIIPFTPGPGYIPPAFAAIPPLANRPFSEYTNYPQVAPRAIQPRPTRSTDSPGPPVPNEESYTFVRSGGMDSGMDRRKKRGRPTKEEAEERDRVLAAEGKVYEPKKRANKKLRASTGTPSEARYGDSPSLVNTPLPQTAEEKEDESFSAQKGSQSQDNHSWQTINEVSSPENRRPCNTGAQMADSPSDRLLARFGDRESERRSSHERSQDNLSERPSEQILAAS